MPRKPKRHYLTEPQGDLLDKIRDSGYMSVEFDNYQGAALFWLPGGRNVNPITAMKLIEHGYLKSNEDGLIEGVSQTYSIRDRATSRPSQDRSGEAD